MAPVSFGCTGDVGGLHDIRHDAHGSAADLEPFQIERHREQRALTHVKQWPLET